jgi:hypothetical protein
MCEVVLKQEEKSMDSVMELFILKSQELLIFLTEGKYSLKKT